MKNKFKWIGIALLSALLIFGLTGCPAADDPPPAKQAGALLDSVQFGSDGVASIDWAGGSNTAAAITPADFANIGTYSNTNTKIGTITVKTAGDLQGEAITLRVSVTTSSKAKAFFAVGSGIPDAADYIASGQPWDSNISAGSYLTVRVTAENGTIRYYVFQVIVQGAESRLNRVRIIDAQGTLVIAANIGSHNALTGFDAVPTTGRGLFELDGLTKTGRLEIGHASAPDQKIKYSILAAGETLVDKPLTAYTGPLTSRTFEDGEEIWVEVTSANESSTNYYIFDVQLGRIATLSSVKFAISGVAENLQPADPVLGETGTAPDSITTPGAFEPGRPLPAGGVVLTMVTTDADATAKWARVDKDTTTAPSASAFTGVDGDTIIFANGDFFYVQVTSASTTNQVILYYKMEVVLARETTIYYGSPLVRHATDRNYIDSLWDDANYPGETLDVSRINLAEQAATFGFTHPVDPDATGHTMAKAKTYWDDDGLYVYMDVDFYDFYANAAALPTDANPQGNPTTRLVAVTADHLGDNVEIFTNERLQSYTGQSGYGNQFRVGPEAPTTALSNYGAISGQAASGAANAITTFENSRQFTSFIKMQGSKQVGYVVVARVPWTFVSSAAANEVFQDGLVNIATGVTDAGPTIGFELQLNTSNTTGSRDAIITWNGIRSQAYNNAGGYGTAELVMGNATRVITAAVPEITTQPADREFPLAALSDATYTQGLSVVATTSGAQTYQWYTTNSPANVTTAVPADAIAGATAATFKPSETAAGTYYYYVVVTNTRGAGALMDSKSTISRTVTVTVVDRPLTPADSLLGTRGTFERSGVTVLYGSDFDALARSTAATPYTNDNFVTRGDANARAGYDLGVVWFTGSTGSGSNALQILKPNAVTMSNPLATYKLMIRGRTNAAHTSGRLTLVSAGSTFPDNTLNPGGANAIPTSYTLTLTLNSTMVAAGFWMHANTWGGAAVGTVIFSIDDLIIVEELAPAISDFAIVMSSPIVGSVAPTTIDAAQFTGTVTWAPALDAEGKFEADTKYTATIVIAAKAGFQAETLTNDAAFTINGVARASYDKDTKTIVSAQFADPLPPPNAITVDFTDAVAEGILRSNRGTLENVTATGYTYVFSGGYDNNFAAFKIAIPAPYSLANFSQLKVTVIGVQGDTNNKDLRLIAGADVGTNINNGSDIVATQVERFNSGTQAMTFTIDLAKAAALSGTVEFAIYSHAAGDSGGNVTKYTFENIQLVP